jgi:hypothetical protein
MPRTNPETDRRVLVVVNEAATGVTLRDAIGVDQIGVDAATVVKSKTTVHLVAPALNSHLRHWLADDDRGRRAAEAKLGLCLDELAQSGIEATGAVGDPEPLQAIADSLRTFPADEIVIASAPAIRARGVTRDLAERAMGRFGLPVAQLLLVGDPVPATASDKRARPVLRPA